MSVFLYAHNPNSQGCRELAQSLGIKRIKHENSNFKRARVVINWGSTEIPSKIISRTDYLLNEPKTVSQVVDKRAFLFSLQPAGFDNLEAEDIITIPFTTDPSYAEYWLRKGKSVVVRHMMRASGGEGIEFIKPGEELPKAPLYTRYVPKMSEYRVHFIGDSVFYIQEKKRKLDVPDEKVDWKIRNHDRGFIYAEPDEQNEITLTAKYVVEKFIVDQLPDLDFGAVDIIYNSFYKKFFVLEVNTAPGLIGRSVDKYKEAFSRYLNKCFL